MAERITALDWQRLTTDLDVHGSAVVRAVLAPQECVALAETYAADEPFRSRIVMAPTASGAANTNTSPILFPTWSPASAARCIRHWRASRIAGTRPWASTGAIRTRMRHFSSGPWRWPDSADTAPLALRRG